MQNLSMKPCGQNISPHYVNSNHSNLSFKGRVSRKIENLLKREMEEYVRKAGISPEDPFLQDFADALKQIKKAMLKTHPGSKLVVRTKKLYTPGFSYALPHPKSFEVKSFWVVNPLGEFPVGIQEKARTMQELINSDISGLLNNIANVDSNILHSSLWDFGKRAKGFRLNTKIGRWFLEKRGREIARFAREIGQELTETPKQIIDNALGKAERTKGVRTANAKIKIDDFFKS